MHRSLPQPLRRAAGRCGPGLVLLALGCPGQASSPCPEGMVLLEAGDFALGDEPSRPENVPLPAFCMDRYEHPNQEGSLPTVGVTWEQARDLCQQAGKRLCSSDEWERACRGVRSQRYVYGDERDPEACNTPWERFEAPPAPYAPSGAHPRCRNAEGVMDLNGNVSEWVQDEWTGARANFDAEAFPPETVYRTVRGGTMWRQTFYGQDCTSAHGHPERDVHHIDDGLRCCLSLGG
jgi:formylglycine-generating enzyme required for sulfatase activity